MRLAHALTITGRSDLAKTASAEYSFTDKDSTYTAYIAAHLKLAGAPSMADAEQYATFWNINDQCKLATAKLPVAKTRELADSDYALAVKTAGETIRKFASYDAASTVEAAMSFYDAKEKLPYAWRKLAADALLKKASAHKAVLPDYVKTYLYKAAGLGLASATSLDDALVLREQVCPAEGREDLAKLASAINELIEDPSLRHNYDVVSGVITALEHFDTTYLKVAVALPEEVIDSTLTEPSLAKVASAAGSIITLQNGATIDSSEIPSEVLAAVDPSLAKVASSELAQILPTLPKPDADLLVQLMG